MDIDAIDSEKRRATRLKQYQLYQDQLDQIEGEKKRTGSIGGKKATIFRPGSSSIQDIFLKIKNKP